MAHASGLKKKELDQLKTALEDKKLSLQRDISDLENSLSREAEDGKGGMDEVDRSSFEEEIQRQESVLREKHHVLGEVVEALERMADGTYGLCLETEEPIHIKRLQAQPWVKFSLEAQQDLEKRGRVLGVMLGTSAYPSPYKK